MEGERDARLAAGAHKERAAADVAKADDAAQVVQRQAEPGFLFDADEDVGPFDGQIGPLRGDVKRVVVGFHNAQSFRPPTRGRRGGCGRDPGGVRAISRAVAAHPPVK